MLLKILSKLANASWQMDNERCLIVYSFCSVGGWMLRLNALSLLWWQSNHASKLKLDEISHRDTFIWDNTDTLTQYWPPRLLKTNNKSFCYLLFHCSHRPLQLFHPLLIPVTLSVILASCSCTSLFQNGAECPQNHTQKSYTSHWSKSLPIVEERKYWHQRIGDWILVPLEHMIQVVSQPFKSTFASKRKCNPLFWNRRIVSELVHMLIFYGIFTLHGVWSCPTLLETKTGVWQSGNRREDEKREKNSMCLNGPFQVTLVFNWGPTTWSQ